MKRVLLIAALEGELEPLVRGWEAFEADGLRLWRRVAGDLELVATASGAGQAAAARGFAAGESGGRVDAVYSLGWAGALKSDFLPGRAYHCSGVVDAATGERFESANLFGGPILWLATSRTVADAAEKRRLVAEFGAELVDMEAAAVARLAEERQIPFHCVKGVSDGVGDRLPDFNRFLAADGRMRLGALIVYALLHPLYWPALVRMGKNSSRAARAMAVELRRALAAQGFATGEDGTNEGI